MTTEQLQKAEELTEKIKRVKTQLGGWKGAKSFRHKQITLDNLGTRERDIEKIETRYIDFDVVKAIAVSRLEKELNDLELEFSRL